MSEIRRLRIVSDDRGVAHIYVVGTDIEIEHVTGFRIDAKPREIVATLEVINPEMDIQADCQVETTISYRRLKP